MCFVLYSAVLVWSCALVADQAPRLCVLTLHCSDETYYAKMEPRAAWILVCDDIAAALGEAQQPNGVNGE